MLARSCAVATLPALLRRTAGVVGLILSLSGFALAQAQTSAPAPSPAFTEAQRGQLREIIKEYLLQNPEIIQEALVALDRRQKDQEQQARQAIIQDKSGLLYTSNRHVVVGNAAGDVTLVEFFDYNCGYCKRALGDIQKLLSEDKNVRFILKEFPVLGPGSIEAAQVSVALKEQFTPAKMWAFHTRLLGNRGQVGKAQALDAAKAEGADIARLNRDLDKPEIGAAIQESVQLADALGLTGTPSYVLADDIVVGAVGLDELKGRIENVRKCGKNVC